MHSLRRFVRGFKALPKARLALALVAAANLTSVAFAAAPATALAAGRAADSVVACSAATDGPQGSQCSTQVAGAPQLKLVGGTSECPASGPAASCAGTDSRAAAQPGVASLPSGLTLCASTTATPVPATPAACTGALLPPDAATASPTPSNSSTVLPSVPASSLQPVALVQRLGLQSDATTVRSGQDAVFTATASSTVPDGSAIEIFDQTSGTLAGACAATSQCVVAYEAHGGVHAFAAYITTPMSEIPSDLGTVVSNQISVGWLDSAISASDTVIGPGHPVTVTATSTVDVANTGRWLEIYDLTTKTRLTYCSRGTTCTTTVSQPAGGAHQIVGYVTGKPESVSLPVSVTWLTVALAASTTSPTSGGTVYLRATTNADLTTTPWVLGIYDDRGRLVDHACKTGHTCSVQAWVSGQTPSYVAEIGAVPPAATPTPLTQLFSNLAPSGLVDVQARSAAIQPTRLLWGVDSCKAFTEDAAGTTGLLPQVTSAYGAPDFWGRYLTNTVCPGISSAEVSAAAGLHMGILPIYNDYDCSAVSTYATGNGYATAAVAAAESLGIPQGRVIAIDIEPPGAACPGAANVDSGFIEGWYDGIIGAGYAPAYYGNGTAGSEFGAAWCSTVSVLPNIARDSYLWSFEPSLSGSYTKSAAPDYAPFNPGCAGISAAWQYMLSAGATPDVDSDEALSQIPLWYPE